MKKEARVSRCTLLNGSALSTEKRYMKICTGRCDIFCGIEHRLTKEEMEKQFNREAKEGCRLAADAARFTDERASSEGRKHTSGGVFICSRRQHGSGSRRRSDWVDPRKRRKNCPSMGVVKQAKSTRHPWLIACDANMCPEDFEKSLWFQREPGACGGSEISVHMQVKRPKR